MQHIQTAHHVLATYQRGDTHAERLALVLPGRLDTKDYPHMRSHVDFLSRRGYFALSFDPPGTWESPGGIELYTMTNYLQAIDDLIEYFGNRPTFLMGHSRGGSVAMQAAMTNQYVTHFAAIMSSAAPSKPDHKLDSRGVHISHRDLPGKPDEKRRFDLPKSFFADSAQYDMLVGLPTCTKPKLFGLGLQDGVLSPAVVREGYDAAAEPKSLVEFDFGHDYRHYPEQITVVEKAVGEWLESQGL